MVVIHDMKEEYKCWKGLEECETCWYEQVILKQPTPTPEDIKREKENERKN